MAYLSHLDKRPITEADKIEAAKNNWAGQILKDLGFSEVDDIHEVGVGGETFSVFVRFKKPR